MEKRYYSEYSQCLDRNMDFIVYGHSGVPLLVFPAQDGHPQDYENFGMVDVIKDKIENGYVQLFCVGSIDEESYSDEMGDKARRSYLLEQFYYYICDEIVPRIKEINGTGKMIYTTGCSLGATHAANMMLRRPDLFMGCIALSGYYVRQSRPDSGEPLRDQKAAASPFDR
uniref:alpha/beta hydrolase-fold protein n=1 Tax=Faecalibacillus intestinalis TaxID=1982626 RepID=UPI00295F1FC6